MTPEFEKFLMKKIENTESFFSRLFRAIKYAFILFFSIALIMAILVCLSDLFL